MRGREDRGKAGRITESWRTVEGREYHRGEGGLWRVREDYRGVGRSMEREVDHGGAGGPWRGRED